ncbi:MAG: peptidoglycan-associated lipoprotein Pal [Deferrisomatales bacterium]
MRRKSLTAATLALALLVTLTLGGCAKKQVRQEGEIVPAAEAAPVREAPLRATPLEPPPPETAAIAPAPVPGPGSGLAQQTSPGLQRIHFDFDQSVIRADAREILGHNAAYLAANPGVQIRVEGHCDERGTTEYNLGLGERRAKSAFQYLMDLGVDPNRMHVVSYGEEVPLDPRQNDESWALNRRAEFVETQR